MPLVAIPNVSEGRDQARVGAFAAAVERSGARVLDLHSDASHNRSVITSTGDPDLLIDAIVALAKAAMEIDLTVQRGVHPRLGTLDVCPFVPHETDMEEAIRTARRAGHEIAERAGLPVYLYGEAAMRAETRELPALRRGGLAELVRRAATDLPPDLGPRSIDPRTGVVCVGARGVLVAFNVYLHAETRVAAEVAEQVRERGTIRALGLPMPRGSQVSMNLIDPASVGIDEAYARVARAAEARRVEVGPTEIVGLVPLRFMPDPDAQAARRLQTPGRSLESALSS
jgi:glutamate formiminotransferase / 5-formyltetrahydrofolate cyclo-ligase